MILKPEIVRTETPIPYCYIYHGALVQNMGDTDREIEYQINNIFVTEKDSTGNQVRTNVGQKETVNITVTGQIMNDYITNDFRIMKNGSELFDRDYTEINLKNQTLNLTFFSVRVKSDYDYRNQSHTRLLYVDTSHPFYDFLRNLLINHDFIDENETGNLKIRPVYLQRLTGRVTMECVQKRNYDSRHIRKVDTFHIKCEKGDNDGD